MDAQFFTVKGKRGLNLSVVKTEPKKEAKAVVQIFHGMGEHKDRYIPFMKFLSNKGFACYAHDDRKMGKSVSEGEEPGYFDTQDRWDDILDDCHSITRKILREHPGKKIIILGHSMGSTIAQEYISRNPLIASAAILSGVLNPPTKAEAIAPKVLSRIIRFFTFNRKPTVFLSNFLNNMLSKAYDNPRTKFDWLTYNEENVDKYIEDPLCGYAYTPQFYVEFFGAVTRSLQPKIIKKTKNIPLLFIAGKDDPVGNFGEGAQAVKKLYETHGYTKLTLRLVDECRHEPLNETNRLETFDYLEQWLDSVI